MLSVTLTLSGRCVLLLTATLLLTEILTGSAARYCQLTVTWIGFGCWLRLQTFGNITWLGAVLVTAQSWSVFSTALMIFETEKPALAPNMMGTSELCPW